MTDLTKAAREALIDTDGENLAVRAFLALYGTSTPTAEGMASHLRMSGFDVAPAWVKDSPGHLTKSGAQDWLRRLFALEEAPGEEREAFEAWALSEGLAVDRFHADSSYIYAPTGDAWFGWQARAMLAARPEAPTVALTAPAGLSQSDAQFWLDHRQQIIEAARREGYTIVTTASGVSLMRLGKIEAPGKEGGA